MSLSPSPAAEAAERAIRVWLERAVIGLNLCPFAKSPHVKGLVHYAVSAATRPDEVLADLGEELDALLGMDASVRETTLLIVPGCLQDFLEFNDTVARADRLLRKRGLAGVVQLASFHPAYQFAGAGADDIENFTNRAPYPTLHLLREASVERAVEAFPDASAIYDTNMRTLRQLGREGWNALGVGPAS